MKSSIFLTMIAMLMFAANSSANVLQKGLYYKSGSGVIYAGERPNDLSFLSKDIAIKNENGDYLITLLTESSQKIAITVLKDKETVITSRDVGLIKKNNPNNAFIQNIKKMTVSDLTETEDSVRFSVNIYSSIDSVFSPEAAETKLSTDVVLTQSNSCSIQYYVRSKPTDKKTDLYSYKSLSKNKPCLRVNIGVNTRLTDLKAPFLSGTYRSLVGFASDIAIRLTLGTLNQEFFLIKN